MAEGKKAAWVVVVVMMLAVCAAREAKAVDILNESDVPVRVVARVNATIAGDVLVSAHANATLPLANVMVGTRVNVTFLNVGTNVSASVNITNTPNSALVIQNIAGNFLNQIFIYAGSLVANVLTIGTLLLGGF